MQNSTSQETPVIRRMPIGAELQPGGGAHFRLWAPKCHRVAVVIEPQGEVQLESVAAQYELQRDPQEGYFSTFVAEAVAGQCYWFRVADEPDLYPDPASRCQPRGSAGPSQLVDPTQFAWTDQHWQGRPLFGQVIYELHIGTFTAEGTWQAAVRKLAELAELGVTVVEVMPIAEFPGRFGWGYDGVNLFAPYSRYGTPDDARAFVDRAHELGLAVILDVVYNHFGPRDNYLGLFSDQYQSTTHHTEWGDALNFDGPGSASVREFFISNAGYWVDEYHFDGLRLDAVQAITDDSPTHVLEEITARVRDAARGRQTIVVAENELQQSRMVRSPDVGGYGLDGLWNDDWHHAARVAMTGHGEYYYGDYQGSPQEIISATKWGYLYAGQWNQRQERLRGAPAWDLPGWRFITFLQNHDQVANSANGWRANRLTSPGRLRTMTAVLLLSPGTPMLFQGQEFAATAPFLYFADFDIELAKLVRSGREDNLRQFRSLSGMDASACFADPCDETTFLRSKIDHNEQLSHPEAWNLHYDLLRLRREDPVFAAQRSDRLFGAVLGSEAFALRFFGDDGDDRLLICNLGRDFNWNPAAEPLIAPPTKGRWHVIWSSENPKYGGVGTAPFSTKRWQLRGHSAIVLSGGDAAYEEAACLAYRPDLRKKAEPSADLPPTPPRSN